MFKNPDGVFINVYDFRAVVVRWKVVPGGWVIEPARNWLELEEEAAVAVYDQGGARNISGQYFCPPELAEKAVFG